MDGLMQEKHNSIAKSTLWHESSAIAALEILGFTLFEVIQHWAEGKHKSSV